MSLTRTTRFTVLLVTLAVICITMLHARQRKIEVHTLEFPMLLGSPGGQGPLQLLPTGTTLYHDQEYPKGFTQYRIYVNVDRYPPPTDEKT